MKDIQSYKLEDLRETTKTFSSVYYPIGEESSYEILAMNRRKIFKNPKKFYCTLENCNKSFGTKGNLKAHEALHICDKRFKCSFEGCFKSYINKCRLNVHERTHSGYKPFSCELCNKGFNEKGNLKIHMRVHTGERPYKCDVHHCKKSFKTKGHLKDHVKIHFDFKPYKCDICAKKFARVSTLKVHANIHSRENNRNSEFMQSSIFSDKINISSMETPSCSVSRFENLVPSSNFIQVYIKNDYSRNDNKSIEALETEGRTIPSQKNSPHEKNFFDSQFFMNNHDDFQLHLNNVCNGDENNVSLDNINNMINRDNENDYMYGYLN